MLNMLYSKRETYIVLWTRYSENYMIEQQEQTCIK